MRLAKGQDDGAHHSNVINSFLITLTLTQTLSTTLLPALVALEIFGNELVAEVTIVEQSSAVTSRKY